MCGDLTSGAEPERTITYVAAMRTAHSSVSLRYHPHIYARFHRCIILDTLYIHKV